MGVAGFSWILFGPKRLDQALVLSAGMVVMAAATALTAAAVDRRTAYAGRRARSTTTALMLSDLWHDSATALGAAEHVAPSAMTQRLGLLGRLGW